jgi:hypothetical protein
MKLTVWLTILIMLVALTASVLVWLVLPSSGAPRFTNARAQTSATQITYDFLNPRPFESGRMWVAADREVLIYDLGRHQVLGELTNAWPVMLFGEPLQVVCYQPATIPAPSGLKQRLLSLVARLTGGRIKVPPSQPGQRYWLLDLDHNAAHIIGDVPGTPNTLHPSPDFHYGLTTRIGQSGAEVYLLDLRSRLVQKLDVPSWGWAYEWWDNSRLLLKTTNSDFVLYEVRDRSLSPLIPLKQLADFLREKGVAEDPKQAQVFAIWNGRENDFYLTDTQQKWSAEESFLIKVERPDGRLRLLSPRFKFGWSDHLDPTGRWYLYSGRDSGDSSDGVFIRDLLTGTNRVLATGTTNHYHSIPRFYGNSVVYVRSNALWQTSLDGSKSERLYPGAETGKSDGQ